MASSRIPLPLPSFKASSAHGRRGWSSESDDRWIADPGCGLFAVADAFGPTYGGHHAPLGVGPGLEAFSSTFRAAGGDPAARLRAAVAAAQARMCELTREHAAGRESTPLSPALAHFTASLTACAIQDGALVVVQVGSCRAYRSRNGKVELLALDHTLASRMKAEGKTDVPEHYRWVVASLLGASTRPDVTQAAWDVRPGDRVLICTDGVWAGKDGDGAVQALLASSSEAELDRFTSTCAERSRDDSTALLISVS